MKDYPKKSTRPRNIQGLSIKAAAGLQSPLPLPAVPCGTVSQAPEGEQWNYRLSSPKNQGEVKPRPAKIAARIAARSCGHTTCETYIRFPVVGCFPIYTLSNRQIATVLTMSHFAQHLFRRRDSGRDRPCNSWCHFSTGHGSTVEIGTTVTSWLRHFDMTTTGRFFTISGGRKPVSKSQMRTWPGFGWKLISMIGQIYRAAAANATDVVNRRRSRVRVIFRGHLTFSAPATVGHYRPQR